MEESASDPIVIPGWIWIVLALVVIGVIVVFVLKGDSSGRRSRRHRRHRSRRHHRHRSGLERD